LPLLSFVLPNTLLKVRDNIIHPGKYITLHIKQLDTTLESNLFDNQQRYFLITNLLIVHRAKASKRLISGYDLYITLKHLVGYSAALSIQHNRNQIVSKNLLLETFPTHHKDGIHSNRKSKLRGSNIPLEEAECCRNKAKSILLPLSPNRTCEEAQVSA